MAGKRTQTCGGYVLRDGNPMLDGATAVVDGANFSIFSASAHACWLVLFQVGEERPFVEIVFPEEYRFGQVWSMLVEGLDLRDIEYGFCFDGPFAPERGLFFDRHRILLDPYAAAIEGMETWRGHGRGVLRSRCPEHSFEWGHDMNPRHSPECLRIYEMHLRGFTAHSSAGEGKRRGTYDAMRRKIPYLQQLGVNCVELMPIFEFDENDSALTNPLTGEKLCNYWGYSTLGFFAPKAAYAASGAAGDQADELKSLVRDLHAAGIEVILDVVFNHTGEGDLAGTTHSFRGIDNPTYYMLDEQGRYRNYSGCGNTMNCNHPVVREFVMRSLRYWATEFRVDGFRFDLASILGRGLDGEPLGNPPLIEALSLDPLLANCKLIAEAWDAGGLYQVGHFAPATRWMEWNGCYRDAARRFLRGDDSSVGEMVQRILGSPDLYESSGRGPTASINFITCHDGFSLHDLFAYNEKHNIENGENNRDGLNENFSWNCGVEGETDDPAIRALRLRQQKNALALLYTSQGIPMIFMGDECGRSQRGNNNGYCHDTEWNWLDWGLVQENAELVDFASRLATFRNEHKILSSSDFLLGTDRHGCGYSDISWHGVEPGKPDWSASSHSLAFMLCAASSPQPDYFLYCAFNMHKEPLEFCVPPLPAGFQWQVVFDTGQTGQPSTCASTRTGHYSLAPHSTMILKGIAPVR